LESLPFAFGDEDIDFKRIACCEIGDFSFLRELLDMSVIENIDDSHALF